MSATTTPAARIGDTAWYLTTILHTTGSCDHCGRALKHLYEVVNPDGKEMTVGRGCVKKITGWTLSYAQAQQALRSAARMAEIARRRKIVGDEYPELAAAEQEVQTACGQARAEGFDPLSGYHRVPAERRSMGAMFNQAVLSDNLWFREGAWREYLQETARW